MGNKFFAGVFLCGLALLGAAKPLHAAETVEYFNDVIDEAGGMYKYVYGGATSMNVEKAGPHSGEACLKITFDCTTWSGAAIGHYPLVDLTKFDKPALEFWVKGAEGKEIFEAILLDADDTDGNKTEVSAMAAPSFVKVTKEWQKVTIPFSVYPPKGQFWQASSNKMIPGVTFNPIELKEIKFAVGPTYNKKKKTITIYVDDIRIAEIR